MNERDYGIVVGISQYPQLGDGRSPIDLRGPENDADKVMAWLTSPTGGGVPPGNARLIKSSQFPAPLSPEGASPTIVQLQNAVAELIEISDRNKSAGGGGQIGRRLYIYMSGHGFSPGRRRGCLFAANAAEQFGYNIDVTGWLDWFQDAGLFQEFVLWMDCCMNRVSLLQPGQLPAPLVSSRMVPSGTFIAFAAPRPLRTVEVKIQQDGDRYHGVFTWALLEGLRGAAADLNGRITGRSLADWLRNAQAARLGPGDWKDPDVAKEPEVIKEDAGLVFARGVAGVTYPVRLKFPVEAVGHEARLWSGAPPRPQTFSAPLEHKLTVSPGLYLVDVPTVGLRHGFEVRGEEEVEIKEKGPPITLPTDPAVFTLDIQPSDPTAEIYVIDSRFSLVDSNPGGLTTPLVPGLFKIKTRVGRAIKEQVILLDRDYSESNASKLLEIPATVRAIDGTAAIREMHVEVAKNVADEIRRFAISKDECSLTVISRIWSGAESVPKDVHPWEGVTIVDGEGRTVIDLKQEGERRVEGDPLVFRTKAVKPGTYFLRQRIAESTELEQSLTVAKNYHLEVNILHRLTGKGDGVDQRPRVSVFMRSDDSAFGDWQDRSIETARTALADERYIMNDELQDLLIRKFRDPVAGIIGAHLLLIEHERNPHTDLTLLNEVVSNLRKLLGKKHPDVAALSLRCPDRKLRYKGDVGTPPMFWRSWRILVEESAFRPRLIGAALWNRVQAQTSLSSFFAWTTNDDIKSVSRQTLEQAVTRYAHAMARDRRPERSSSTMGSTAAMELVSPNLGDEQLSLQMLRQDPRLIGKLAQELRVPRVALEALPG